MELQVTYPIANSIKLKQPVSNSQVVKVLCCLLLISIFAIQEEQGLVNKTGDCFQFYRIFKRPIKAYKYML